MKAISDYARSKGIKTLVWFEPERITPGTWLAENHPEWILAGGKDGEDRQGITEIKHVVGYLAYWDELLRRHPEILLDSDERRNDLESMRRAVPLWRSDQAYDLDGGITPADPHAFWSCCCPSNVFVFDIRAREYRLRLAATTV